MAYVKYIKDPDSRLDYTNDWSSFLGDDIILSSSWEFSADLESDLTSFADDSTTIWLAGGELGNVYPIVNRIVTNAGRIVDRTFYIQIEEL